MEYKINNLEELVELGRAEEIDTQKENKLVREIVSKIKRTMRKNNLTSLSAPAVGYNKRIFCVDYSDNEIKTYINPVVSLREGIHLSREVCSSIPDKEYIIPRNNVINIYYQRPNGEVKIQEFKGLASNVLQHELDHLEGITLDDMGLEIDKDFDEATDEERLEIVNMYLDSLDIMLKDVKEDIENNEELKVISDRLNFTEAVVSGKVKLMKEEDIK
jgi:peptide deformylase|nr:MAG TPA: Polypeptide deformylase [Caudoviricetes sp.]